MCRLGLLCNSSTASGSSNPGGTIGLSSIWAVVTFFCACQSSLHFHSFLLAFFLCFFALFQSFCFHVQMFVNGEHPSKVFSKAVENTHPRCSPKQWRTPTHESGIFYRHTEWNLLTSLCGLGLTQF